MARLITHVSKAALALVLLATGCVTSHGIVARGTVAGQTVHARVDGRLEKFYIEEYLTRGKRQSAYAESIEAAIRGSNANPYDAESLAVLSRATSPDFAALYFASSTYSEPANKAFQDHFHGVLNGVSENRRDRLRAIDRDAYIIAFVPGYGYKMDTSTGSDFASQRRLLEGAGFHVHQIETDEVGTVEKNAAMIAEALQHLAKKQKKIVLVSASKGGPEVALALSEMADAESLKHVKSWINVGGILRGSPYADYLLGWPRRWFARALAAMSRHPWEIVRNLSTETRRPVFEGLTFSAHILIVSYVGVPLASDVGRSVRGRYKVLSRFGPNDGLTLLADETVPRGITLTDLGLDHYFRDPEIDAKTLALAVTVIEALEGAQATTQQPAARAETDNLSGARGG